MGRLPRRVLHVLNGAGGGAAQSVIGLARALAAKGVESSGVTDLGGTPEEIEALRQVFGGRLERSPLYWWNKKVRAALWKRPVLEARQLVRTGLRLRSALAVVLTAQRFSADLIHTNNFLTPEGAVAARLLGLPHVWHVRELIGPGQPYVLAWPPWRLRRFLRTHRSVLIANSEATARQLNAVLPDAAIRTTFNGVDLSTFECITPRPQTGRPVVAMVAHLTSRTKKHALFLEAARLASEHVDADFRIYGNVPSDGRDTYADRLKRETGVVRLMGPGAPAAIMKDVDLLVHPADNESFGRTVVEAMAAGKPAVGVRRGGVGETIVDGVTGLLADPDDASGLARAIERLVRDPMLRLRMGSEGRRRAQELYSIESCAEGVAEAYSEAMSRIR
jgi:glycosyltransferase involved in cell wall biosynthesis